jgi:hypothetical protein
MASLIRSEKMTDKRKAVIKVLQDFISRIENSEIEIDKIEINYGIVERTPDMALVRQFEHSHINKFTIHYRGLK